MSVDLFVAIRPNQLPTVEAWQAELDRLGAGFRLDETVDPTDLSGFWPTQMGEEESGFEFMTGSVEDCLDHLAPDNLADRNLVAVFTTHSDLIELRCSMFATAALASLTDGVIVDGSTSQPSTVDELLEQARDIDS